MSFLIRQLNLMSSLKAGSDREKIFPLCKAFAPVLAFHPAVRQLHKKVVTNNLELKTRDPVSDSSSTQSTRQNLAIIFCWMLPKASHIDKFCDLYISRGFDVLTVNISPWQMLFPTSGSQVVVTNILDYLNANKQYQNVLVHAFSVGGYLMGEMFVKYEESKEKYKDFPSRVVGMVLDSGVDFEGIPTGFPRAVAKNPLTVKALEWYINTHLALLYNVATKHYIKSSKSFHNTPLSCPALFLVSKGDKVGTPSQNRRLADDWEAKGVDVYFKCWERSAHVSHMYYYKDEYISEIDNFLSKLKLSS